MAKKIPSNFYQEVNIRKLDKVFSNEGDLPTPSVSDEGKVIKVNDEGKYALLPDGGAQTMTVAITYDETTEEYSADKTHAEIVAAIAGGIIVTATYDSRTYVYAGKNDPSGFDAVYFSYLQADSEDQLLCKCFEIDSNNRIVYSSHDISEELPIVDSSDNGKILQVVNGNWTANLLSSAQPVVKLILDTLSSVSVDTSDPEYDYITMYADNIAVKDYLNVSIPNALTDGIKIDLNTHFIISIENDLIYSEFECYKEMSAFKLNNLGSVHLPKLISILSNSTYGLSKEIGYGNISISYKAIKEKYYISIEIRKAKT